MKGIMFNHKYGMWDAVLKGAKTNTRRISSCLEEINTNPDNWKIVSKSQGYKFKLSDNDNQQKEVKSRFKPGDICYLQEPTLNIQGSITKEKEVFYAYPDHAGHSETETYNQVIKTALANGLKWKNKMFMDPEDARYFIRITSVSLQRLHDISDEDCIAEGIETKSMLLENVTSKLYKLYNEDESYSLHPQKSYESLLKAISGPESWDNNHWCFSIYFELLSPKETNELKLKKTTTA